MSIQEKIFNVKVAKSCTYRVISFAITFSVTLWASDGNVALALSVGPIDQFFKFFVYFWHEGQWDKYLRARESAKMAAIDEQVFGPSAEDDDEDDE